MIRITVTLGDEEGADDLAEYLKGEIEYQLGNYTDAEVPYSIEAVRLTKFPESSA